MKKVVEFDYNIGEEVGIRDINRTGRIDAQKRAKSGLMYRVIYWNDGERRVDWLYDWELTQ